MINHYANIHIQFPFCDIRKIFSEKTELLPLPNWKLPIEGRHFIQYFGHMERRTKEIPQIFADENFYIKGRGGIKFVGLEKSILKQTKCIYRKLLKDQVCGVRYEVGLTFQIEKLSSYSNYKTLIENILLSIPVNIKHTNQTNNGNTNLLHAGKKLCHLYEKATSKRELSKATQKKVDYGNLCLLFELVDDNDAISKLFNWKKIDFPNSSSLLYNSIKINGKNVAVFFLTRKNKFNKEKLRKLRVMTLRMYFEYENLKMLLNFTQNPNYSFNHELLDKYFMKKISYFNKSQDSESERGEVYRFIFSFLELIAPSEIEILSNNITSIRLQIKNQLLKLVQKSHLSQNKRFDDLKKKKIREALIRGKIEQALNILNELVQSEEVILINYRYNECVKNENLGIVGRNQTEILKNQIVFSILKIVDKLKTTPNRVATDEIN